MLGKAVAESVPLEIRGRIVEVSGTMVRATIPGVRIGEMVTLRNPDGSLELKGEVVGLSGQMAVISPLGKFFGLASTTEVTSSGHVMTAPAGPEVLGRVLDGLGRPIDEEKKRAARSQPVLSGLCEAAQSVEAADYRSSGYPGPAGPRRNADVRPGTTNGRVRCGRSRKKHASCPDRREDGR